MSDLSEAIKMLAVNANEANQPDTIVFGVLSSIEPIVVQINEKLILSESSSSLIIAKNFIRRMNPIPCPQCPLPPPYAERGDRVMLIRTDKGNKYILLDVI